MNNEAMRLRLLRKTMGLENEWLANVFGVNKRTVVRWQAGDFSIPPEVAAGFDNLVMQFQDLVDNLVEQAEETGEITFVTGSAASPLDFETMPPSMFNAAVGHALMQLEAEGIPYQLKPDIIDAF